MQKGNSCECDTIVMLDLLQLFYLMKQRIMLLPWFNIFNKNDFFSQGFDKVRFNL